MKCLRQIRMHQTTANATLAVAFCVGTLLMAAMSGCGSDEEPTGLRGMTRTPPTDVSGIALPDHGSGNDGRRVSLVPAQGELMLVYFGYTSCPDVCPTTLADIRNALDKLPPDQRKRVAVAMVTVDPKRDTAKTLPEYLGHFFPKDEVHAFRSTNRGQLETAETAFGATHSIGKPDKQGDYEVGHSAVTYAVGSGGRILVEWPFGTLAEDIAADLKTLLATSEAQQQ